MESFAFLAVAIAAGILSYQAFTLFDGLMQWVSEKSQLLAIFVLCNFGVVLGPALRQHDPSFTSLLNAAALALALNAVVVLAYCALQISGRWSGQYRDQGRKAFTDGLPRHSCPYTVLSGRQRLVSTLRISAWNEGYTLAQERAARRIKAPSEA